MSVGVYVLPAGAEDPQSPHAEEEIYHVLAGRATFWTEREQVPATPGSVLYVAPGVRHRFEGILEELRLLVVFAPPHAR